MSVIKINKENFASEVLNSNIMKALEFYKQHLERQKNDRGAR